MLKVLKNKASEFFQSYFKDDKSEKENINDEIPI